MEFATVIGIMCLIAGFVLVGIEMVVPGFGFPGIAGIAALAAGIFLTAEGIEQGIMLTVIIIVILGIMLTAVMVLLSAKKLKFPLVLGDEMKTPQRHLNNSDLEYLVGKEGRAVTDLRPEGKGSFDEVEFNVRSRNGYIIRGERIRIVQVKGNVLLVASVKGGIAHDK